MTTEVSPPQIPITFGDLKRHPDLAPQQKNGHLLIQYYSALVFGVASALLPNEPAAHERIVWVVFDLLTHRWKRVPKKTTLAAWLLRTAWFAVQREQRALDRPKTPLGSELMARALLTKYILRLSPNLADPIVLVFICQNSIPGLASAWRTKEATLAARAKKRSHGSKNCYATQESLKPRSQSSNPSPFHSLRISTNNSAHTCRRCYP